MVYLLIKCKIELNQLEEASSLADKHIERQPNDIQLKLAKLKILKLQSCDLEEIFNYQLQVIFYYLENKKV